MYPKQDNFVTVGVWIVVIAAITGLLVLILQGSAGAATREVEEAAGMLRESTLLSGEERLAVAQRALREDRQRRIRGVYESVVDASLRVWGNSSPRSAFRSAGKIGRALWALRGRSPAEDRALELLEAAHAAEGNSAPQQLYAELHQREVREMATRKFEGVERALEQGQQLLARVRLERAVELWPESPRAEVLRVRLGSDAAERADRDLYEGRSILEPGAWEAPIAAALLAGRYARAIELGPEEPGAELARAAARCLRGDHDDALRALQELSTESGLIGSSARAWAQRPEFQIEASLARAGHLYRARRALGWLGGSRLATQGLEPSRRGYSAWNASLSPLNLALSFPARVIRRWRPDGSEVKQAAQRYLELRPHGPRAPEALRWMEQVGWTGRDSLAWDDGRLVLPRPRTHFARLAPSPLVVTRAVLDSEAVTSIDQLRSVLQDAPAISLRPVRASDGSAALDKELALRLLAELARGLEQGDLRPLARERVAVLGAIRRLDSALRDGRGLEIVALSPDNRALREGIGEALLSGGSHSANGQVFSRGEDDVALSGALGGGDVECPADSFCIDQERWISAGLYAGADTDAVVRLGARASLHHAQVALELSSSGPHVSLSLPVARWLRIDRWVPLEARVEIGTDGFFVGPRFTQVRSEPASASRSRF